MRSSYPARARTSRFYCTGASSHEVRLDPSTNRRLMMRVLGLAALEGKDLGVLDYSILDFDRVLDRSVGLPSLRSSHHSAQKRDEGLADIPGGRVP